ncbi:MAG: serine/threonine-protein kinase, partial [Phycisphaerae bacterium]
MPESSDNSSKRRAKRVPVGNRPSVPGEGTVVLGDFELRREIGRGGMGTVYEAWQRSLQRVVALKVLGQHISSSSNAVQRFKREAHAAARLHHTHIIPIFAQGEESGVYYYAMELVEGPTLNDIISTARQRLRILPDAFPNELDETVPLDRSQDEYGSEGEALRFADEAKSGFAPADAGVTEASLPAELTTLEHFVTVARHIASAAEALEYAHAEGVIHRDIKPHNLIMGVDNRLRISDFGLARISEEPGVAVTG